MAPSRAVAARVATACMRTQTQPGRLAPRLFSTTAASTQYTARTQFASALRSSRPLVPSFPARSYSQEAGAAPEPPEFLSEGELHIFNKIKAELEPVKLEVCFYPCSSTVSRDCQPSPFSARHVAVAGLQLQHRNRVLENDIGIPNEPASCPNEK
jgi:hypothetical protein